MIKGPGDTILVTMLREFISVEVKFEWRHN